ncbi:ABC transporter permease [Paenibacillus sp. y28]|uniref:ABC transporter permease n=1 Tax=Paenibacillus sp. y28 TaxID=3129110 RepID=UPI00301A1D6F
MSLLQMAWRNLFNRRVQTLITVVVVAIGVAMALSILLISGGMKQGIVKASEPFGMLVGAKGSANQLVFNTIFLMDNPLANLPPDYYHTLERDPRVAAIVPFALGDNYQGFRLVGTSTDFFDLRGKPGDPPYFQLAQGRLFDGPFQAVIGARTAKETGLKLGDTFVSGHGTAHSQQEDQHAEHPYTVVGILRGVAAPSDQGLYVSMDSYWVSHEHEHGHAETSEPAPADAAGNSASKPDNDLSKEAGHADHDQEEGREDEQGVTAALVKTKSYTDLFRLYQEINQGRDAQAVLPGQVISKIFDMLGSGEEVLRYISYVVLGMAGMTIVAALYGSTVERRRTVAILRAIGAGRGAVLRIVLLESILVVGLGCLLGCAAGQLLSWGLASYIGSHMSVAVAYVYTWQMLWLLGGVAALGGIAGLIPAVGAYRTETARYLNAV